MVTWLINEKCNFKCEYCTQWRNNKMKLDPIDINRLSDGLGYLKSDWVFHITGGEPFLEKNFIGICQEITKNHFISLNTNLSTKNVYDFANQVNPQRTLFINAAVHIKEREKHDSKLSSYIEKILYLQKRDFNVIAYYVAHPDLFNRIENDIAYLKSKGVEKIRIKIFKGIHNGNYYPKFFNSDERVLLESLEADYPEFEILKMSLKSYGHLCLAGQRFLMMSRNGDMRRCSSLKINYGNLFEKTIVFDFEPKPCPINTCGCQYEGIRNMLTQKGSIRSVLKEDIIEKSSKAIHILNNPKLLSRVKEKAISYFAQK